MPDRHIVAIGGGGLSRRPDSRTLVRYLLDLTGKPNPFACFIPTASAENLGYTTSFYEAFSSTGCRPSHLMLFTRTPLELRNLLLNQDLIYVGGGNTKSMLAVWREWDVHLILREAWEAGVVLSGVSAGAICWFEYGVTDSWAEEYRALECLGFLTGSCCPHYDGESDRQPFFRRAVETGAIPAGIALEDNVAAHYVGTDLQEIVTTRPGAKAYHLEKKGRTATEEPLPVRDLPG